MRRCAVWCCLLIGALDAGYGVEYQEKQEKILNRLWDADSRAEKWKRKQEKALKRLEKVSDKFDDYEIFLKSASINNDVSFFEDKPDFVGLKQDVELEQPQESLFIDDDANTDNHIMLEGDIIVPVKHQPQSEEEEIAEILNAVKDPARLWPKSRDGIVRIPYLLERNKYSHASVQLITEAMDVLRKYTCVSFENRRNEPDFVRIAPVQGCAASVGKRRGRNDIYLDQPNCMKVGIIIHELLHIVGFNHEQSRSDRDKFVDIIFDNIVPGNNYRVNFNKAVTNNMVVYDYNSVLHYPRLSWNKKPYLQTIVPKTMPKPKIGQRDRLSPHDIEEVRGLYTCDKASYNHCGEELDTSGWFKNQKYPNGYEEGEHCTWKLTASAGKYVELTLEVVDMFESYTCEDDAIIVHDGENAMADTWSGICGQKSNIKITSTGQSLYVIFATQPVFERERKGRKGFKASFRTVSQPGDGPPPIQGNTYGPVSANTKDDFFCNFNWKNNAKCGMQSDGLIADFNWEIGNKFSQSDKTGYQPNSKKPDAAKNAIDDVYDYSTSISYDVDLGIDTSNWTDEDDRWLFFNSKEREVADTASIMTPWLSPTSKCIKFDFLMYSSDSMGTLNVKVVEINDRNAIENSLLSEITGKQGLNWKTKDLKWEPTLQDLKAVKFIFEGWVYGEFSDILMDNLNITAGCSAEDLVLVDSYDCDFEKETLCGGDHGEVEQNWQFNKGQTPSKTTGPIGDHTTGTGTYLFMEASQPTTRGDRFQLKLPALTNEEHCLSFWYHMYGTETGSLRTKMKLGENGIERALWEQSGERLDKWYRAEIEIDPSFFLNDASASVIEFEADENDPRFDVLSSGQFSQSNALYEPDYDTVEDEGGEEEARRKRRQAAEQGLIYTGGHASGATGILLGQEDIDAMQAIYNMSEALNGMQMDVAKIKPKEGRGLFITIEGERGHGWRGDMAIDDVRVTDSRCSIWSEWSAWNTCSHTCGGGVQIRERECALKNIEKCKGDFKENRDCNMHTCGGWSCNFDNGLNACGIRGMKGQLGVNHDFVLHSGYTPTGGTGPMTDVSGKGRYIFLESSKPARAGDNAMIGTKAFQMDSEFCLTFSYHMWSNSTIKNPMGQLNVYMLRANKPKPDRSTLVWSKDGDQGRNWRNAKLSIPQDNNGAFKFMFEATRGASYKSDIAIDEISLINTNCDEIKQFDENSVDQRVEALVADLDLQRGLEMCDMNKKNIVQCGWSQLGGKVDAADFKRSSAGTPSGETGPEAGRGPVILPKYDEPDQYMYLEASDVENGQGARLKSVPMASIPYCVSFDYHMWGSGTGALTVTALEKTQSQVLDIKTTTEGEEGDDDNTEDDKATPRELIMLAGDKGNLWNNLRLNYRPTNDSFQVAFDIYATRGTNYKSDIAIDNIIVKPGPCIEIVSVGTSDFSLKWGAVENLLTFELHVEPPIASHTNGNTTVTEVNFIRNVSPDTEYKITLKTLTKTGDTIEEFNSEASFRTLPKLDIIRTARPKSFSIELVRQNNTNFAGYEISVWPESETFKNGYYMDLSFWTQFEGLGLPECGDKGSDCVFMPITGLRGGSLHSITVRGIGRGGANYKSNVVKVPFSTAPLPPAVVQSVKSTGFGIRWQNAKGTFATLVSIEPQPVPRVKQFYGPKDDILEVTGLQPNTEFNITFQSVGQFPRTPRSGPEAMEMISFHVGTQLSDKKYLTIRTGPEPPKLAVTEQRKDSVKIDWSDYAEDEATYMVHLNPSNGMFHAKAPGLNRAVEVQNKFLELSNLHPGIEYTMTLSAKFDDTETDDVQVKFMVNCERHHHQLEAGEKFRSGPYNLGDSWTFCAWVRSAPESTILGLFTQKQPPLVSFSTTQDSLVVSIPGGRAEKTIELSDLAFVCLTQDADEQEHRVFVNSEQIETSSEVFTPHPSGMIMLMAEGPGTIIDSNIWPFVLSEAEINIQRVNPMECITGMIEPANMGPPSSLARSPPTPEISIMSTTSSEVEISLGSKGLVTKMFVELKPPSSQFKNGIKSGNVDGFVIKGLDSDTVYEFQITYFLAAQKSESGRIQFSTAAAKPAISAYRVASSEIYLQWDEIPGAVAYELISPDAGIRERLNVTDYGAGNLNGSTEYNFGVRAVINEDENIRTDYAKTTIFTVPSLNNFNVEARSTSLILTWDVSTQPDFYNLNIHPAIPNFDGNLVQLESPLVIDNASPSTMYMMTMTATYTSDGYSGYQGITDKVKKLPRTAPLLENSRIALLQSSQIAVALGYVMGANDLRVVVEPPIPSIRNGLQGGFANFVRLTQMTPLTRYEIAISALVAGAETDAVIFTEETAPSGSGVSIEQITSSSVQVSWSAVEHVTRYRVILKKGSETVYDDFKPSDEQTVTLSYLDPESSYNVFISGEMENRVRTDPASQKFTTLPQVTQMSATHVASTSFTVEWPEVEGVTRWDFKVNGEVTIHLSGMHSATVTSLVPSTEYSLSLVGVFDDVRRTDMFFHSITTSVDAPQVDLSNVQSTAFNILWKSVPNAEGYSVVIDPPVDDFENSVVDSSTSYLSIFEAEPNTDYSVTIKAIFSEIDVTDETIVSTRTAFVLETPEAHDVTETSAMISWEDHSHDDEEEEADVRIEGSAEHEEHLGVINYFVNINPAPQGSAEHRFLTVENTYAFENLQKGTTYVVEVIAVLTSGAQTDIADFEFTTAGEIDPEVETNECGFDDPANKWSANCDFEGGGLCGWGQSSKKFGFFRWRVDTERNTFQKNKVLIAPINRNDNLPAARLMSQPRKGTACLSLRALMFQKNSMSLSVKVRFETSPGTKREETIISYGGDQGGDWFDVQQTIYMPQSYLFQVVIEATKTGENKMPIAIDDIKLESGPCWSKDEL